jgi:hypothetical protein
MEYSSTEIELKHNKGYIQALHHVMNYLNEFDVIAVKRLTTSLIAGTQSTINRLEIEIEAEHEAEYQAYLNETEGV